MSDFTTALKYIILDSIIPSPQNAGDRCIIFISILISYFNLRIDLLR